MSFDDWKAAARSVDERERVEAIRRGRKRFIWRERILPFGLPIGLVMSFWAFRKLGYGVKDAFTLSGAAVLYFCVAVTSVIAYLQASHEWDEMKSKADKQSGK